MKRKMLSILFYIFTAIIFIAGTWGLVYEFVILDKSIIPDFVNEIALYFAYGSIAGIIIISRFERKHKNQLKN